eukprot:2191715-Pleurochrysis_carterae.AAC.1
MKYRQKIRASKRWIRKRVITEAKEANIREGRKRGRQKREKDERRRGGAGGGGRARALNASSIEEEHMRDIGAPQYTWWDGSCWLWAVAGALHKLEGKEGPTEKDIQLEKDWRAEIQDTVRAHGIPMAEDELRGLSEGVQYTQGRLTRGGTWGGGTEHQALAMIFIRSILYSGIEGKIFLKSVAHTSEMLRQSKFESIHLLYDDEAKHSEFFGRDKTEETTTEEYRPAGNREVEVQKTEAERWEEGKKVEK